MPDTAHQPSRTARLVSWNTAGRVRRHADQIAYLKDIRPDILAIQEAIASTIPLWRRWAAEELQLEHFIDSRSLAPDESALIGPQKYAQIFASRFPIQSLPPIDFPIPWQERVLSALIRTPGGVIEAHTTHIPPGSSHKWLKIETFEGIYRRLARRNDGHRLLCGDFNMPRKELPDGRVFYWGTLDREDGSLRRIRDDRWCAGERSIREGLAEFDLSDAYRMLHQPGERVDTWIPKQGMNSNPRRFDHLYASKSLGVIRCDYDHDAHESRLSDHSILIADMEFE